MDDRIRFIGNSFFDADEPEEESVKKLLEISELPQVEKPCVALPDLHFKKKMESPSSAGIAVKGHIVPHFSSTSLNCGMGLIATPLMNSDQLLSNIGAIFNEFRREKNNDRYEISTNELFSIMQQGPKAILPKYDIDTKIIDVFEDQGDYFDGQMPDLDKIKSVIPNDILYHKLYSGRTGLGTGLGGNHFLEIQEVKEIFNAKEAEKHNINKIGQILIMYHGGGGIIPGIIGAYFSRRKKGYSDNLKTNIQRYLYHLKRTTLLNAIHIYKMYLSGKQYIAFPVDSTEGKRINFANNCAMNYGFAYRLFFFIRVRDVLKKIFGLSQKDITLCRDKTHNLIKIENINGKELVMHRHNSCRAQPGEMLLLPGFYDTNSYCCMGLPDTQRALNTVPHGAGDIINKFKQSGISSKIQGQSTLVFRRLEKKPELVPHFTDEGVTSVIRSLHEENILEPIVKMSPIAVLKDFT